MAALKRGDVKSYFEEIRIRIISILCFGRAGCRSSIRVLAQEIHSNSTSISAKGTFGLCAMDQA